MTFDISKLRERLQQPLPGALAHDIMRATPVGSTQPNFIHKEPARPGAVLILLYKSGQQILFPLIKRQEYLGAHSGQVSLPGGKAEHGEDAIETALREGEEEIGIDRTKLDVIGKLSDFFVIPSNFLVTPVVAFCDHVPAFRPDPREVSRIMTANLADLVKSDAILNKEILAAGKFRMQAPHFEIDGEVVWGATAMMLNELCEVIRALTES